MTVRKHLLTTGATGMLGTRLMVDALEARVPIVVLVRPRRGESATDRIEGALQSWERAAGRVLKRPVVISADLQQSGLGITKDDRRWLARNCDTALHCAASVRFYANDANGEPFRTNVAGLNNFLEVCDELGIRHLHHVSTAYVCGLGSGPVLEDHVPENVTERDLADGRFGNDYEQSKAQGEQLVRSASFLDTVTLFRPSIIVGDSKSGATSAFHGIYTALQLGYLYLLAKLREGWQFDESQARQLVLDSFISQLGLSGDETKNLVPVDWVSAVIAHVLSRQERHGRVYHLTNPHPVSIHTFTESMMAAVLQRPERLDTRQVPIPLDLLESDGFREHMHVYRSYFRDDPEFDTRNTISAAPDLACPVLDHETMVRMWQFAVNADFTDPRRKMNPSSTYQAACTLRERFDALTEIALPTRISSACLLELHLSGPGGGSWLIQFEEQQPVGATRGGPQEDHAQVYTRAEFLLTMAEGTFNIERALHSGRLIVRAAGSPTIDDAIELLQGLLDWIGSEPPVASRSVTLN